MSSSSENNRNNLLVVDKNVSVEKSADPLIGRETVDNRLADIPEDLVNDDVDVTTLNEAVALSSIKKSPVDDDRNANMVSEKKNVEIRKSGGGLNDDKSASSWSSLPNNDIKPARISASNKQSEEEGNDNIVNTNALSNEETNDSKKADTEKGSKLSSSDSISSGYSSSPPTTPSSPSSVSPPHTLKRSKSSNFRLIDRRSSVISLSGGQQQQQQQQISPSEADDRLADIIGWYPAFLLRALYDLTVSFVYVSVTKLPIAIPTLWLSGWLWLCLKCAQLPLAVTKAILTFLFVPPVERYRKKRTVLISGGSTVQTIHLARNFYSAGARVVVCEIEGRFGLANFSTAVHKYYTVPEPNEDYMDAYINALKAIVSREKVSYYIPVSESYSAYYDALAKPHIEALNCQCFCPDVKDVCFFDDTLEFMNKVQTFGAVTPSHFLVQNRRDLDAIYDAGIPSDGDYFMITVGPASVRKKRKIKLPDSRRNLKLSYPLSDQHPWLVVRNYRERHHFVTCSTIKESRVVANVTCRLDRSGHGLVPVQHNEIETWLRRFFADLAANNRRRVTGHMSFLFVASSSSSSSSSPEEDKEEGNANIVPLDCQVGVRLPYICYTSVHPRVVWKPCRHFSRSTSGPIVTNTGRYWVHEIFLKTVQHPSVEAIIKSAGILFDRKEALFVFWDPLPYCAFYYLQLPLNSISAKLTKSI